MIICGKTNQNTNTKNYYAARECDASPQTAQYK